MQSTAFGRGYSGREYPTADAARIAAQQTMPWLSTILDRGSPEPETLPD
jgi:hypothetical protein